jgi:uncharacterized membrane protein YgcG
VRIQHRDIARFRAVLERDHWIRMHSTLLLVAATLAGLLASKLLLWSGLSSPVLRFPMAVAFSYATFIVFVDLWLRFIGAKRTQLDVSLDFPSGDGNASGGSGNGARILSGKGGTFDGGGASSRFDAYEGTPQFASADSSWAPGVDAGSLDVSDADALSSADGLSAAGEALPLVILGIVLAIFAALVGWVFVGTPGVLLETAVEAAVTAGLIRSVAPHRGRYWLLSLCERTWLKAALLIAAALLLGFCVRLIDPQAHTVGESVHHALRI